MIEESKLSRSFAWLIFICGIGVGYLAVGESLIHVLCDILQLGVHPPQSTGRMESLVQIIGIIAGFAGGAKWLNYKRAKDCILPTQEEQQGRESAPDKRDIGKDSLNQ